MRTKIRAYINGKIHDIGRSYDLTSNATSLRIYEYNHSALLQRKKTPIPIFFNRKIESSQTYTMLSDTRRRS